MNRRCFDLDINDLESVCAVDICHNYSEAAESIASSPAVISKHIAKVEKELGLRIFERASKSRPVELTPAGQELITYFHSIVGLYKQMSTRSAELRREGGGSLVVGYCPFIGNFHEAEMLTQFSLENPEISVRRRALNAPELVRMMVGRPLSDLFNKERDIPRGQPRLRVEDLTDGGKVKPSSLVVHAGEIVGLAGLVGAGRSELAQLIFGVRKATAGVIEIDGEPVVIHSPREAIDLGIGFLTENRKEQGLFLELAAQENITMATLERDANWGMLNRRKAQTISDDAIQLLNIRVPHAQVRAGGLSGGNQQKLLISRWVAIGPRILILDEPTRGVDVGAKSEIYRIMNDMARQGVAILMISSELPEVVGMSDRVYVMREGVIAGELQAGDISQESIMTLATGVTDSHLKAGQL